MKYASLLLCRALLVVGIGISLSKPALAQSSSPIAVEETLDNKIAENLDNKSACEEVTETNGRVEALQTIEDKVVEAEARETAWSKVEVTTEANGVETRVEDTIDGKETEEKKRKKQNLLPPTTHVTKQQEWATLTTTKECPDFQQTPEKDASKTTQ